jgi:hypothetical protein
MPQTRKAKTKLQKGSPRLYTLEVILMSGPLAKKFVKKNPVISRTIQMRGDQTLEDLHQAIFDAFGRWEEHMYEFQFGKGPMDPKSPRYVLPGALETVPFEREMGDENPPAGQVDARFAGPQGKPQLRLLV